MGTCLGATSPDNDSEEDENENDDDLLDTANVNDDSNSNSNGMIEDDDLLEYGSWGESFVLGKEDEDDEESKRSTWLPLTSSTSNMNSVSSSISDDNDNTSVQLRETHRRLEEQEKKIDYLIQLVQQQQQQQQQQQNAGPATTVTSTSPIPGPSDHTILASPPSSPTSATSTTTDTTATATATATHTATNSGTQPQPQSLSHGAKIVSSVRQQPVNFTDSAYTTAPTPASAATSSTLDTDALATTSAASAASATGTGTTTPVAPLKVMLFIDGTWLYYSIHERKEQDCPIIRRFGKSWQHRYRIDWSALPHILCEDLKDALMQQQVSAGSRPAEIVRASVFTSYKADTSPNSYRYKMYQDLKAANYDVHMMETVGKSEKCIDIQLAVEMLHYATVPGSYDVALLLTGDKDFMPAMIRTRQKGRKVGLVSMKRGCNRALYETDGLIDYNVVWLEEHLDRLVVPKEDAELSPIHSGQSKVSLFTLIKTINDFINNSGFDRVSSRDLGRYLKSLEIGGQPILDIIKDSYGGRGGGLSQFLIDAGVYIAEKRDDELSHTDPTDRAYWVRLGHDANNRLVEIGKKATLSKDEKAFFSKYSLQPLEDKAFVFGHTILINDAVNGIAPSPSIVEMKIPKKFTGASPIRNGPVSMFTLMKTINDFLSESGFERVSSRDLGRYLKSLQVGEQSILDIIKDSYGTSGGLSQFLVDAGVYFIESRSDKLYREDPSDRAYWVRMRDDAVDRLTDEAKKTTFCNAEKTFFDSYSLEPLEDKADAYGHTSRIHESEDIVPPPPRMNVSTVSLAKLIDDFIAESGFEKVSSRDLGKYLKSLEIGKQSVLEEIKQKHGPLVQFLRDSGRYDLEAQEGSSAAFLVSRRSGVGDVSTERVNQALSSSDEKEFFENYSPQTLKTNRPAYWHTKGLGVPERILPLSQGTDDGLELPEDLVKDYSECTVAELKERCRERGLAVSGVKAALLDRIQEDLKAQITRFKDELHSKQIANGDAYKAQSQKDYTSQEASDDHLVDLVVEYLRASGGKAGSASVGRYLAANNALQKVKGSYGSLSGFIHHYSDTFELFDSDDESYDFQIVLRKDVTARV
jgi:hypothetical protein